MRYQIVSEGTPADEPTVQLKFERGPGGSTRLYAKGPAGTDWAVLATLGLDGTLRRAEGAGAPCFGLSDLLEFDSAGRIRDAS